MATNSSRRRVTASGREFDAKYQGASAAIREAMTSSCSSRSRTVVMMCGSQRWSPGPESEIFCSRVRWFATVSVESTRRMRFSTSDSRCPFVSFATPKRPGNASPTLVYVFRSSLGGACPSRLDHVLFLFSDGDDEELAGLSGRGAAAPASQFCWPSRARIVLHSRRE